MEASLFSLLPPVVAIVMVILTRRVLLSLGVGIILSALLLENFNPIDSFVLIYEKVRGIIFDEGFALNTWNMYIVFFLLILGIITALLSISGGSRAFGEWALQRVKTRAGAQVMTAILGVLVFIDDYFNSLAVGQVARPVTDRHKVSRAKLAYILDSTAAPICVVSPISSWGAYIIGLIGTVLVAQEVTDVSAFSAFMQMIPMNLYVWAAMILVFVVALRNLNFGSMAKHENRAMQTGELLDPEKPAAGEMKVDLPVSPKGKVMDLVAPIIALVIGVVVAMLITGAQAVDGPFDLLATFENTDVAGSLLYGGIFGLVVTVLMALRHVGSGEVDGRIIGKGVWSGIQSMLPAIYILFFAWTIVGLIEDLKTGEYLAGLVQQANLPIELLPVMVFIVAGVIAFSTGTSWGSFGILLPIAGQIAAATDISILLPAMAAVLAGAVFGDHCSPISDTSILSSTGASSNHIDHVMTQLPYALLAAFVSIIGYIVMGYTSSVIAGVVVVLVGLAIAILILERVTKSQTVTS
ncbi:Na+/H+ antiporter NhaC family protein [Mangrovibacillus cuniculi]|uniref:Na+/H+ antiporter NhaC family protein n=1 Tax=Mangrovibacillus cuniculi TaxID=2593652 RepID=A0A7S8HGF9_9BACI|nr:Na+/H+ antiporter NhaC family protein [Mangrovibacillus cuniculi]QPC47390.1 Na+/H+ antiporter NhaC family protein [Mangrovibacillus cuniculi]